MKTEIQNLIVFGDSMSDIGSKWTTAAGRTARLLQLMRVNEIGRYSDGRNWTDFLWEWSGGLKLVADNAKTTNNASNNVRSLAGNQSRRTGKIFYCNYAEGGAMGASDRPSPGLGTFMEQLETYLEQRKSNELAGNTLHVVWFGLNDLVTNKRDPQTMGLVVDEIDSLIGGIAMQYGNNLNEHFVVLNLPSPAGAVRFIDSNDIKLVKTLDDGARIYNKALARKSWNYRNVSTLDVAGKFDDLSNYPEKYGIQVGQQPQGVPVNYQPNQSISSDSRYATTSDGAHPTEAVHKVIAAHIARGLAERFEIGDLSKSIAAMTP